MAKELPYFKFNISEWMMGRIQKHPESTQGMFMNLCCKYWHKLGEYTLEDAFEDFGKKKIQRLIDSNILICDGEFLKIKFLDEQINEREEASKKNSIKGLKSAEIRAKIKQQLTTVEPVLTSVQPSPTIKIREEKNREEERREDALADLGLEVSVKKLLNDELWNHDIINLKKNKNLESAVRSSFLFLKSKPQRFKEAGLAELKITTVKWLENMKPNTNGTHITSSAVITPGKSAGKL